MKKFLKIFTVFISILIVFSILAAVLLITFINPNRFKPLIIDQVMKHTGRQLTIDGNLSWSFFPSIGFSIGHAILYNPTGFVEKTFAEINSATLSIRIKPLIHGRIESNGLVLNGLHLHLVKKSSGETNWNFSTKEIPAETATSAAPTPKKAYLGLMLSGIDISGADITWIDEQANKSYAIMNFSLNARDVNLIEPFPINSSFDFIAGNHKFAGQVSITSQAAFNMDKQIYSFREMTINSKIEKDNKKLNLSFKGNVIADLAQDTIQTSELNGQIANVPFTGIVNISKVKTQPVITGKLTIPAFDLKQALKNLGEDIPNLQSANDFSLHLDFSSTASNSIQANGKFLLPELQMSNVELTNFNGQINFKDQILNLTSLSANVYQGNLEGNAKINLVSSIPQYNFNINLTHVQAASLLNAVSKSQQLKINAIGNINFQISTLGIQPDEMVKNLNGSAKIDFNQGSIEGIDIGFLLDSAQTIIEKRQIPASNSNKTDFASLHATSIIQKGVITNNDLYLDAPRFDSKGSGSIDLVNKTINYQLQTIAKQAANQKNDISHLFGMTIPILITGSMEHPKIALDTGALLKSIAEQQVKNAAEKILNNKGNNKIIPNNAGEILQGLFGH